MICGAKKVPGLQRVLRLFCLAGWLGFESASGQGTVSEGFFNYVLTNGEAVITAYEGPRNTNVIVPETLGGFPVRQVSNAFKRLPISGINLPSTMRVLDVDAFASCTGLTNVVIPEGVTEIHRSAFWECANLTEVVLPESLQILKDGNFMGCRSLRSVRIPALVKNLDYQNFFYCSALTNAIIAGNVTNIGDRVFSSCQSLTNMVLPASLVRLGEEAFANCAKLESIVFLGNSPSRGALPFAGCDRLTVYYLEGTTGWQAFMDGRPTKMIPARATILRSPVASSIRANQALSNSILSGGSNTVAGTFGFADPTATYGSTGTYPVRVIFTPVSPYTQPAETTVQVRVLLNNPEFSDDSRRLPVARFGTPFTHTLFASNHIGFGAEGLPDGLQIDSSSGVLSGSPEEVGTFPVRLLATNADGTNAVSLSMRVYRGTPRIEEEPVATPLWPGQPLRLAQLRGGRVTRQDGATSIPGTFRWAVPDRKVDALATPQRVEFHPEDTRVYETASFPLAPSLYGITSDRNPEDLALGTDYQHQLSANLNSVSFRASGLPPGLRLEGPSGKISGRPRQAGVFRTIFSAATPGSEVLKVEKTYRVLQKPVVSYPVATAIRLNRSWRLVPKISGFPAPRFVLTGGNLPPGLLLDAKTGTLSGSVPSGTGSYPLVIGASSDAGSTEARVTLTVR